MQKKIILILLCLLAACTAFGYNPPPQGERMEQLVMPQLFSGGVSTAGGALKYAAPEHIAINPAIIAGEQRIAVDFGWTALFENNAKNSFGSALNAGFMIPSRWGVAALNVQGIFSSLDNMNLGNLCIIRGGFARDITDDLYVGASFAGGFGTDWAAYGNLGFVYRIGNWKALKNLRWGVSLNGLGKTFNGEKLENAGIDVDKDTEFYPGFITPRTGLAATIFSSGKFEAGASVDLAIPTFQNVILDIGFQACYGDIVTLHSSWEVNARELAAGRKSLVPSIGLSVKFGINTGAKDFFNKNGWQRSDIVTSAAYAKLNDEVNAVSAAGTIFLGLRDTTPPDIQIWVDEPVTQQDKTSESETETSTDSVQDETEVQSGENGGNQ